MFCTGEHYLYFFRHGYMKMTVDDFDPLNANLSAHVTHTGHAKKLGKTIN